MDHLSIVIEVGGGGRIRTSDLWVMSPTSCLCSTPRHVAVQPTPDPAGRPQRPRLPRRYHRSTLRRCPGSRLGSGWDQVGPGRSRPRAPRKLQSQSTTTRVSRCRDTTALTITNVNTASKRTHTPLTIRTAQLQSVASCPLAADLPDRLSGVSQDRSPRNVSS